MHIAHFVALPLVLSAAALAQTPDTGTAHKAAATALLNSNNTGAAHLACPAAIVTDPSGKPQAMFNPPGGGPARGAGAPAGAPAAAAAPAGPRPTPAKETWYAEGGQVFDNLYMLTTQMNSAWAVKTSEGIILIDSLYGYAAQDEIVDGMKKLGLDPADIKYLVLSHAHGDHDGSVKFLQDTYHPHVILAPKDWELASYEPNPYQHDMDATDGEKLTLGDTTITIYFTPGHTGGTLSFLVPVKDHGVPHMAFEWGGTALNPNISQDMLRSYISNAARMQDVAAGTGADVIIGNHTEYTCVEQAGADEGAETGRPQPVGSRQGRGPQIPDRGLGMRQVVAGD